MSYKPTYEDPEYYDDDNEADWQDMEDLDEDEMNDMEKAV